MAKQVVVDKVLSRLHDIENIRNISVIAHVDHGKSTLTDSLIARGGLISEEKMGSRWTDFDEAEKAKGITIQCTSVPLPFDVEVEYKPPSNVKWTKEMAEKAKQLKDLKSMNKSSTSTSSSSSSSKQEIKQVAEESEQEQEQEQQQNQVQLPEPVPAEKKVVRLLVNLIDSPGHVDFNSEVTSALRVTDGALVVVDCVEGVCIQTQTVLRQALTERVKPVLFLNKMDRVFLELNKDPEEIYLAFSKTVESVNVVIGTFQDEKLGDVSVHPEAGNVGFGSALHGWGFTLEDFAALYHDKYDLSKKKMMKKLWGDNFWDPKKRCWSTQQFSDDGRKLERGFTLLIAKPLHALFQAIRNNDSEKYNKFFKNINLNLDSQTQKLQGKDLLKAAMHKWIPVADALLRLIYQLPSPVEAQRYRVDNLYSGPQDDAAAMAIRNCDPNGPLMMYVSKMIPTSDYSHFYAFGRIFSGTAKPGQLVRIQGPEYVAAAVETTSETSEEVSSGQESKDKETDATTSTSTSTSTSSSKSASNRRVKDLFIKKLPGVVMMIGPFTSSLLECPCGNVVGLVGIDNYLVKTGTVTNFENAHNIVTMKHSVSPVVRVAVTVVQPADLPKLTIGLKRLAQSDPLVLCSTAESGEHVIAAAGELHLQVCLDNLRDKFMKGAPIKVSQPVVPFRETITDKSDTTCISKSANKLNRVFATAQPLGEAFCRAVDNRDFDMVEAMKAENEADLEESLSSTSETLTSESKKGNNTETTTTNQQQKKKSIQQSMTRRLVDDFKWDLTDAKKLWCFGCPPDGEANVLVDTTRAVAYLSESKSIFMNAFQEATSAGIFTGEPLRGVRINLMDAKLHADSNHRGIAQLAPAFKRAVYACQIASKPALMEPMYECQIAVPRTAVSGVYSTLSQRRASIVSQDTSGNSSDGSMMTICAHLPVMESFGFTDLLRKETSGQAFPQMVFSHWEVVSGDLNDVNSTAHAIAMDIRKRKGMPLVLPKFTDYHQKL